MPYHRNVGLFAFYRETLEEARREVQAGRSLTVEGIEPFEISTTVYQLHSALATAETMGEEWEGIRSEITISADREKGEISFVPKKTRGRKPLRTKRKTHEDALREIQRAETNRTVSVFWPFGEEEEWKALIETSLDLLGREIEFLRQDAPHNGWTLATVRRVLIPEIEKPTSVRDLLRRLSDDSESHSN